MNFKLLGKTILVVHIKFGLLFGPSTQPVRVSTTAARLEVPKREMEEPLPESA